MNKTVNESKQESPNLFMYTQEKQLKEEEIGKKNCFSSLYAVLMFSNNAVMFFQKKEIPIRIHIADRVIHIFWPINIRI